MAISINCLMSGLDLNVDKKIGPLLGQLFKTFTNISHGITVSVEAESVPVTQQIHKSNVVVRDRAMSVGKHVLLAARRASSLNQNPEDYILNETLMTTNKLLAQMEEANMDKAVIAETRKYRDHIQVGSEKCRVKKYFGFSFYWGF